MSEKTSKYWEIKNLIKHEPPRTYDKEKYGWQEKLNIYGLSFFIFIIFLIIVACAVFNRYSIVYLMTKTLEMSAIYPNSNTTLAPTTQDNQEFFTEYFLAILREDECLLSTRFPVIIS